MLTILKLEESLFSVAALRKFDFGVIAKPSKKSIIFLTVRCTEILETVKRQGDGSAKCPTAEQDTSDPVEPCRELKKGRINLLNKGNSTKSKTRTIEIVGEEIVYILACDGIKDYATYDETLYKVLIQNRLRPFRDRGRLKFNVRSGGVDVPLYLYDLVYACKLGYIDPENFLEGMERYYDYKSANSLSVDHADNNTHNNTKLNLSLMGKIPNLQKSTIVAGFKPPYYLNVIHCDGEYRVQAVFEVGQVYSQQLLIASGTSLAARSGGIAEMKLICRDAEDLVACLKMLYESTYEWTMMYSTPKEHRRENKDVAYWAKDINLSILAQKELAAMNRKAFDVFSAVAADGSV